MSEYFPKLKSLGVNMKVDLKNPTGVGASKFYEKFDLAR